MATFHDRTTAPRVQGQLLAVGGGAAPDRRAIGRDGWARARELAARLGGEVRDHVTDGMRQAWAAARGLIQTDNPAQSRSVEQIGTSDSVADYPNVAGAVLPLLPVPAPLPSLTAALTRRRAIFGAVAVDEPDTAAEARAIHARRELHGALEWGFAFLDAFDLGPAALDVIDGAIARMDERDAIDEDREPYLAGYYNGAFDPTGEREDGDEDGDELDRGERDTADDEAWLGWPEDIRAEMRADAVLMDVDAELDDADLEEDDRDEDRRAPWPTPRDDRFAVAHV